MGKKKKVEGEVIAFPATEEVVDPRASMTPEEIQAFMQQEEEELERRLNKFIQANPKPDTSSILEEDDEEEEAFTIDLSNGIVTQKVGSGIINAEEFSQMIKEVQNSPGVIVPVEPTLQKENPYTALIRDLFVRKAIAKEIKAIRDERDALEEKAESMPPYLSKAIVDAISEMDKKRIELTKVIRGNKVHYEDIPEWVESKIKDSVEDTLTSLILLADEWQG